jgi:hypothetical protein
VSSRQRVALSASLWMEISVFVVLLAIQLAVRASVGLGWAYLLCMIVTTVVGLHVLITLVVNVRRRGDQG